MIDTNLGDYKLAINLTYYGVHNRSELFSVFMNSELLVIITEFVIG